VSLASRFSSLIRPMSYNECDKTHHGVDSKENLKETRMYERRDDCPVKSLDLYLAKLRLLVRSTAYRKKLTGFMDDQNVKKCKLIEIIH
jgi:hypothetical protein